MSILRNGRTSYVNSQEIQETHKIHKNSENAEKSENSEKISFTKIH